MLPGFNHNIRYRDRVFHVQTEDSGLSLPRLISQLFLDGQVLAYEKTTYEDILAQDLAPEVRDSAIRNKMQDQHKGLMKNLMRGTYDDVISCYVEPASKLDVSSPPDEAPSAPLGEAKIPPELQQEAEVLFVAPDDISEVVGSPAKAGPTDPRKTNGRPHVDAMTADDLFSRRPAPLLKNRNIREVQSDPTQKKPRVGGSLEGAIRGPGSSSLDAREAHDTGANHASDAPPVPAARRTFEPGREDREVDPGFGPDLGIPASDTLVDFGLPAGLRERLRASLSALRQQRDVEGDANADANNPPGGATLSSGARGGGSTLVFDRDRTAEIHQNRQEPKPAAPAGNGQPAGTNRDDRTLLDVDSAELRWQLAQQREVRRQETPAAAQRHLTADIEDRSPTERLDRRAPAGGNSHFGGPQRPKRKDNESRPNILVVERSLDEVILSYLSDDES